MEEGNNEVQLLITASAFTEVKQAIEGLTNQLSKTTTTLKGLDKASTSFGKNASRGIQDASKEMSNFEKSSSSALKKISGLSTGADFFKGMIRSAKRASQMFMSLVDPAVDYTEQLNLFNVVFKNNMTDIGTQFSEAGLQAEKFQQTLHEAFGTNLKETRQFQALYQSMGENMGIVTDKAELMSSNLEKLTYDLASLYNTSEEDVGQAIRAGVYAGQTKPLRRFGIDVTQVSMQPVLDELGIEKSISELSQAEKQLARYLSVLKQSAVAHGDFANTIESPANQLKIFKQQALEARIAIGNLFIGLYAKILPYANAIIMVIKSVAQAIASFFGIKATDYNSGISTTIGDYNDLEDSIDGVGDSAGKASKAIKELKRQTLGFDQINNLTTPTPSSGSSGGGGGGSAVGGIDQRLLDALKGYENGMEKVRMKANEIRDSIMKWLGFTKQINPETGEITWKYEGLGTTIKNLKEWFSELNTPAKIFVGLGVGMAFYKIYKWASMILKLTGLPTMFTKLISGGSLFASSTSGLASSLKNAKSAIKAYKSGIVSLPTALAGISPKLGSLATAFEGLATSLGISVGALLGWIALIVALVVAIGAVFVYAYKTDEDFRKSVNDLGKEIVDAFKPLVPIFEAVKDALGELWRVWKLQFVAGLESAVSLIKYGLQNAIDGLTTSIRVIKDILNGDWEQAWKDIVEGGKKQFENFKKYLKEMGQHFDKFMDGLWGQSHNATTNRDLLDVEGISKETKKRLRFIMDDFDKLETYVNEKKWSQSIITDDDYKEIYSRLESIKNEFTKKTDEMRNESKKAFDGLKDTDGYKEIMDKIDQFYDGANKTIEEKSNRINEIYRTAKEQHRQITQEEYDEIRELENQMKDSSIGALSQSQEEQKALREQMRLEAGSITLQQASEIIANSAKARDETIKNAKEQYTKQIAEAQKLKEAGIINEEEYNKMVENAKNTRDETIKKAEEQHKGVYDEFAKQNQDIANYIDQDTGKVKSKWDLFTEKIGQKWEDLCKTLSNWVSKYITDPHSKDSLAYKWDKFWVDLGNTFDYAKTWVKQKWDSIWGSLKSITIPKPHFDWRMDGASASGTLRKVLEALNLPTSLPKLHINWYASGGIPTKGTLFGAGENGPEVVGHINGRSEVLNQSQLASVMYEAVSRAISNSNLANGVEFYAHTDEGVVIDRINRITRQTGECPLTI
jgi:phage-related protein